jgi:hypothetical protein
LAGKRRKGYLRRRFQAPNKNFDRTRLLPGAPT